MILLILNITVEVFPLILGSAFVKHFKVSPRSAALRRALDAAPPAPWSLPLSWTLSASRCSRSAQWMAF
eukprot:scaffold7601_cov267-Pinguiococcus_pyrenoidosus.AAC.6